MNYLLDTHVLLYLGSGEKDKLGKRVYEIYKDIKSGLFISQISYWEISIKINIGKLVVPIGLHKVISLANQVGIEMISIKNEHILNYQTLPKFDKHKDPFDRYIISVAQSESLAILSSDKKFDFYENIIRIWD